MESLCVLQDNNLSTITKTLINFKKTPKARLTVNHVKIRLENLEKYWEAFRDTHNEILKIATLEQRKKHEYFDDDIFSKCEEEYIIAKCDLTDVLEKMQPQRSGPPAHNSSSTNTNHQEVKLPKISIPHFNGNYNDWNTFQDLYMSLIHSNNSLSNIQKMHYLKTSLTGEAEQLLKHIPIADKNYEVAWDTLKDRYNNRRVIVNTIFNRLMQQKKLTNATAKGIKDLLDTTTECLNNLKNNDVNTDNWDPILIHIIVNKLEHETHKEWEEELKSLPIQELPTWKKFHAFLEGKFRVLEMIEPTQSKERPNVKTKTFHASAPETNSSETSCAYCKGEHIIFKCQEFIKLEPTERSEFVKNERLCYNCLWPGHTVIYCRHNTSCHKCRRKHHTILHENKQKKTDRTDTEEQEKKEDDTASTPNILSHVSTQSNDTLLATALVNIQTDKGNQTVRALIDPCSQESFISESAAKRLQLRKREVKGQVTGIGKMSSPIRQAVELQITSRLNNKFKLGCTAFIMNQVTKVIPTTVINNQNWVHFTGLQLADPNYNIPGPIDLLLGVNVYTEILMNGIIKTNQGVPSPIAQQTQLGWIISGRTQSKDSMSHRVVSMHLNVKLRETETLETNKNEVYYEELERRKNERGIVSLPFRTDDPEIQEDPRKIALKRFKKLENQERNKIVIEEEYKNLEEDLILEYMDSTATEKTRNMSQSFPDHVVIKGNQEIDKVRVEENCRETTSFNHECRIGLFLQDEQRHIIPETEAKNPSLGKCAKTKLTEEDKEIKLTLLKRFESLEKLLSEVAHYRRLKNLKKKDELTKPITNQEKEEALTLCLKIAQQMEFRKEIENLQNEKAISYRSRLLSLNPYLDEDGVIRAGSRLKNASMELNRKHPIILTKDNY